MAVNDDTINKRTELFNIENKKDQPTLDKIKVHLETLDTEKEKLDYLEGEKLDYLMEVSSETMAASAAIYPDLPKELFLDRKISILQEKVKRTESKPVFKLSEKKNGAKINLIRVLNALYELGLIDKTDGQTPTKQEFMATFGNFLGVDLSKYHTNLSQALQNQPLEVNLKVFEDMKEATQKAHYQNKTK